MPNSVDGHSDTILAAVAAAATSQLPLYITEYAVGNHDDASAAAGIVTYIPRLAQNGPALYSYWAFSDVFEEHCLDPTPFHNGWGLVNWQGVPKPSFRAFQMLHEAGNVSLPVMPVGLSAANATHNFSVATGPGSAVTVFATAAGPTVMLFIATFGGTVSLGSPNITVQLDLLCGSFAAWLTD